jgi:hypothetical protein
MFFLFLFSFKKDVVPGLRNETRIRFRFRFGLLKSIKKVPNPVWGMRRGSGPKSGSARPPSRRYRSKVRYLFSFKKDVVPGLRNETRIRFRFWLLKSIKKVPNPVWGMRRGSGPKSGSARPPSRRYRSKVRYRTATDYGPGICIRDRIPYRTVRIRIWILHAHQNKTAVCPQVQGGRSLTPGPRYFFRNK